MNSRTTWMGDAFSWSSQGKRLPLLEFLRSIKMRLTLSVLLPQQRNWTFERTRVPTAVQEVEQVSLVQGPAENHASPN
eukprot:3934577-Rhodomonas_salina.2